ncbi:MAG: PQQ-binding-like beta-propeller repeat protein [Luteolibacter sp.]
MKPSPAHLTALAALLLGIPPCHAESPVLTPDAPVAVPDTKGGFDFIQVDAVGRRLLANHTRNGTFDVFDLDSGKLLKLCPTGAAQGVAVDEKGGKYYVGVSKEKKLVTIDAKTLEKTGEVTLSGPADDALFNPKNGLVYVCHDDGKDVWVIDPATGKIVASVEIGEAPEVLVYDAGADRIYQNIKSSSVAPATGPHGLALDGGTHRLFVAGANGKLVVLDSAGGKLVAEIALPPGVDQIAIDPALKLVYCPSSKQGTLAVFRETESGVESAGEITIAKGCHSVAVDPQTHAVWIAYAEGETAFIQRLKPTLPANP